MQDMENTPVPKETCECEECAAQPASTDTPGAHETNAEDDASPKHKAHVSKAEKKLSEENTKLQTQLDEQTDKYMRVLAEYDNYRKRTAKEKESLYTDASADVLAQILPVLDNLERAEQFGESDNVADGVRLITSQFRDILGKLNVTEIPALSETFDPNVHNAVMHVEDESYGANTVIEVFQKGYIKGDRVIRPAVVKVAN